jgi:hypothetical protein
MTESAWSNQIENRNFLSPLGFKFILTEKPKIDFFCNTANIPGISLGVAIQPTPLKFLPIPGEMLEYEDLSIKFLVDENMENWLEVYNWMIQFGFPDSFAQYQQLLDEDPQSIGVQNAISGMSDATLIVYTSSYTPNLSVRYKNIFPVSLSSIQFESTPNDVQYASATAVFKYEIYDIIKLNKC